MNRTLTLLSAWLLVVVVSAATGVVYHFAFAMSVEGLLGDFVSWVVLPVVMGAAAGTVVAALLNNEIGNGVRGGWWLPASGGAAVVMEIVIILHIMSQAGH
jgi:hypothetical protein